MTELLKQKLNDSAVARWSVLAIVSLTMMCGYFLTDAMSPLMTMLEEEMAWTSKEFGIFNWAYCWFNVFLFMLIFGGLILDKMGVRFTGTMACILMVIGCGLKYYAVEFISPLPEAGTILGIRTQVMVACLGYAIFAVGTETCGITVTKVIAKWFAGKEMALAMGSQVAVARLGTALAMIVSPVLVKHFSMSTPMFVSLILLCIGLLFYLVFCVMDRKLDAQTQSEGIPADEDSFRISDLKLILTNKGFWLLALLCLMFYSAVFPFLKYATSLMENKYGMGALAGTLVALVPFGNLIMTPLFGGIYDKKGKGATIMIIGSVLLIMVHLLFAMPLLNHAWFAAIIMILLGVAFSLVPSAMWPSVPKIIPHKQLGSAYALIFWIQNIGLGFVPLLIGWFLDKYCIISQADAAVTRYNYTPAMLIFATFGILALILAIMLKREDKKKNYHLEELAD
ncbi:MAG: MFS transporter [Bacteroidales bacterium]|nr:MFS transporter [Bacteroidales bacterium]MBO5846503.1 MFS transporter [Bacteroidales bacterium]